jgi:hypothetical protein
LVSGVMEFPFMGVSEAASPLHWERRGQLANTHVLAAG